MRAKENNSLENNENIKGTNSVDPVIHVDKFNHVPRINFGDGIVGGTFTQRLKICNNTYEEANVEFHRWSRHIGFFSDFHSCKIPPSSYRTLEIGWQPYEAGPNSSTLQLTLNKRFRLQCSVHGNAKITKQESKKRQLPKENVAGSDRKPLRRLKLLENDRNQGKTRNHISNSVSNPVRIKNSKMRRVLYDDQWMEKQEVGFTSWINYSLHLLSNEEEDESSEVKGHLRVLTQTRQEARIRHRAYEVFHTGSADQIMYALDKEIAENRLQIRIDRELHADLGLQAIYVDLLCSYHPAWLRLGLETILGEILPIPYGIDLSYALIKDQQTRVYRVFKRVIVQRFIKDYTVIRKYSRSDKVPHGTMRRVCTQALNRVALKRFLFLVYFLDTVRLKGVMEQAPKLFLVSSKFKSSQSILQQFCTDFLSGEGNFIRHLQLLGYSVSYKQTPLDEFDMKIRNLAIELRDGVRLVRLVECLTNDYCYTLSKGLRLPIVSRLQKIHNVDIALKAMIRDGISFEDVRGKLQSKDIVDGHREKTLLLLWKLISHYKLSELVDENRIEEETHYICKGMTSRALEVFRLQEQQYSESMTGASQSMKSSETYHKILRWCRAVCANYDIPVSNFTSTFADGRALCYVIHYYHPKLLMKREIRKTSYDIQKEYAIKCLSEKTNTTESTLTCIQLEEWISLRASVIDPSLYKELLRNERKNFCLVNQRVRHLGSVPLLVPEYDSRNIPEEKIMYTFLLYLQSRLFDSSREIRASFKLQRWWRRIFYRRKRCREFFAALVIQRSWCNVSQSRVALRRCRRILNAARKIRDFMFYSYIRHDYIKKRKSLCVIKRFIENYLRKSSIKLNSSKVILVQCCIRRFLARKSLAKRRLQFVIQQQQIERLKFKKAVIIQRNIRRYLSQQELGRLRIQRIIQLNHQEKMKGLSISRIQKWFRICLFKKRLEAYRLKRLCVIKIQFNFRVIRSRRALRVRIAQKKIEKQSNAAVRLQCYWRMKKVKSEFCSMIRGIRSIQGAWRKYSFTCQIIKKKQCCTKIQSLWRMHRARKHYMLKKQNITRLQLIWKAHKYRKELIQREHAATIIQRSIRLYTRKHLMRKQLFKLKEKFYFSAVRLQSAYRRYLCECKYRKYLRAISVLQRVILGASTRRKYVRIKYSAMKVQRWFRTRLRIKNFLRINAACKIIQNLFRRKLRRRIVAAVVIQRLFKGYNCRLLYFMSLRSICKIQSTWKSFLERRRFKFMRSQCILIQTMFRCYIHRRIFQKQKVNCVFIQTATRGFLARKKKRKLQDACIVIQCNWKRVCFSRVYREKHYAVIKIQSYVRMFFLYRKFQVERRNTLCIQQWYRFCRIKIQKKNAISKIQNTWKAKRLFRLYMKQKRAIVFLQCVLKFQIFKLRRRTAMDSCILLQRWARVKIEKSKFMRKRASIIKLQCFFRGATARRRFNNMKYVCVSIQSWYRGHSERQLYNLKLKNTILIQRSWRRYNYRILFLKVTSSICTFQRLYRYWKQNRRQSSIKIQSLIRMIQTQKLYQKQKDAVVVLQRHWRDYQFRRTVACVLLQSCFRGHQIKKKYKVYRCSIIALQRKFRMVQSRRAESQTILLDIKAIMIQSLWRGYKQRLKNSTRITNHLEKLREEYYNAVNNPSNRLCARFEEAVNVLCRGKMLSSMIKASMTMELCTRLSRESCHSCIEPDGQYIVRQIFAAIHGCNRSRPSLEFLHFLLLTMMNLVKYTMHLDRSMKIMVNSNLGVGLWNSSYYTNSLFSSCPESVNTLVDILHMHRDHRDLFPPAAKVLKAALSCPSLCSHEVLVEISNRLERLHLLLSRKGSTNNSIDLVKHSRKLPPSQAAAMMKKLISTLDHRINV